MTVDQRYAAVEVLYRYRHTLNPDLLRSLHDIWFCAVAARYREPAEAWRHVLSLERLPDHDVAACEAGDDPGAGRERGAAGHAEDALSDGELRDVKRDATALYRAVIRGDQDGVGAIVEHTRCQGCLAAQAAILGVFLVAEPDSLSIDGTGHIAITGAMRAAIDASVAALQDTINGIEAGADGPP